MKILKLVFILLCVPALAKGAFCENALSLRSSDPTELLASYLSTLMEQRVLDATELHTFIAALQDGRLVNPILPERTQIDSRSQIHHKEIQTQIQNTRIDKDKLLAQMTAVLRDRQRSAVTRTDTQHKTADAFQKIEFHTLPTARFRVPNYAFEMMSTHVTQKHWVEIMGKNPATFITGDTQAEIMIDGKLFTMLPNHPVETITLWSAMEFANRLSLKGGLRPAYDLSQIEFTRGSRPEHGTWTAIRGQLIINSPTGDIRDAEGFRIPTIEEFDHVMDLALRPVINTVVKDPGQYAWGMENSGGTTHPVAELLPLRIGENNFYDLSGNVTHWINALNPLEGIIHLHGQSFSQAHIVGYRSSFASASQVGDTIGFRLVRTLK